MNYKSVAGLVFVVVAGSTNTAVAEAFPRPAVVGVHTLSLHTKPGFNGKNPGLFGQWSNGVTVGTFYNSYDKISAYGGWYWQVDDDNRFGVLFALASGYGTDEGLPVAPVVAPSVRFSLTKHSSARVSLFPDPRKGAAQVLHLSFEWRLK